jgi:hypothetical protein
VLAAVSLAVASLVLTGAPAVSANPSSVPPWEEGYAHDDTLLRRLAFVMKDCERRHAPTRS